MASETASSIATSTLDAPSPAVDAPEIAPGVPAPTVPVVPKTAPHVFSALEVNSIADAALLSDTAVGQVLFEDDHILVRKADENGTLEIVSKSTGNQKSVSNLAAEAADHPHNRARRTFVEDNGRQQPAPAPRFSRTPAAIGTPPAHPGEHSSEVLADWGVPADRIERLVATGTVVDT